MLCKGSLQVSIFLTHEPPNVAHRWRAEEAPLTEPCSFDRARYLDGLSTFKHKLGEWPQQVYPHTSPDHAAGQCVQSGPPS